MDNEKSIIILENIIKMLDEDKGKIQIQKINELLQRVNYLQRAELNDKTLSVEYWAKSKQLGETIQRVMNSYALEAERNLGKTLLQIESLPREDQNLLRLIIKTANSKQIDLLLDENEAVTKDTS